jgi:type VI secretion system Hcp family effector
MSDFHFFMKILGSQGPFNSENPHGRDGWILCFHYGFKGKSHEDPNLSEASAARSHEPLLVVKGWDAASPQLMQAFWNNEILKEVVLEFVVPDGKGATQVLERITLGNATVVSMNRGAGAATTASPGPAKGDVSEPAMGSVFREEVGFRFVSATHENVPGKTKARFDWKNRR